MLLEYDGGHEVHPVSRDEGEEKDKEAEDKNPLIMTRTSLEKHPGTDGLPDGLRPGGEGGRIWLELPGVRLVHDGTEGRGDVDCGSVTLTT